jgi:hypothetical protein
LKLLPLGTFDVILGMEWLKRYSPMHQVDWNLKTMTMTDKGQLVSRQGIQPSTVECSTITVADCCSLLAQGAVSQVLYLYHLADDNSSNPEEMIPLAMQQLLS